jgi:hypothetical protein
MAHDGWEIAHGYGCHRHQAAGANQPAPSPRTSLEGAIKGSSISLLRLDVQCRWIQPWVTWGTAGCRLDINLTALSEA